MSLTRATVALAVAGVAAVPTGANAFVQYCTPHTAVGYACSAPERPGCAYGQVHNIAFMTAPC
jgi:hypothetical protein